MNFVLGGDFAGAAGDKSGLQGTLSGISFVLMRIYLSKMAASRAVVSRLRVFSSQGSFVRMMTSEMGSGSGKVRVFWLFSSAFFPAFVYSFV